MTETITEHLEKQVPQGTKCTGCSFRKRWWLRPFCNLTEEFIRRNDKHCVINDPREETWEIVDFIVDARGVPVYMKVKS